MGLTHELMVSAGLLAARPVQMILLLPFGISMNYRMYMQITYEFNDRQRQASREHRITLG